MFNSIKTGVLAVILISTALFAQAQKKITEGSVIYTTDMNGVSAETPVKFSGDINSMHIDAGPASIDIIADAKNTVALILISVPIAQKQFASKMNKEDVEAERAKQPIYSDFKATGEKQVISGYNAEKYTTKDADGKSAELWVTTDIEIPVNNISAAFKEVKGTVVKFTSPEASFTLKSVKEEKVGELSVTRIPDGYEELSYADLMAMQGGGQ